LSGGANNVVDIDRFVDGALKRAAGCHDEYEDLDPKCLPVLRRQAAEVANQPRFSLVDSAAFAAADYRREWLVRRLLVAGQPAVLGGPFKGLKTSTLVDLAISLGTATPFLGHFPVDKAVRVGFMSGESGDATLQDTARRVCRARGVELGDALVWWGFTLPQLADPEHLDALQDLIRKHALEVLLIDPLYLALLAGPAAAGKSAANLYDMGPLLLAVAQRCLAAGCMPLLAHHYKQTRANEFAEPELGDLSHAGIAAFVRQWVLLGRREKYVQDSGSHRMWLAAGGSAGQSGLWAMDVEEGLLGDDFTGRRWEVTVTTAAEARHDEQDRKQDASEQRRAEQDKADDGALLAALDRLDPDRKGIAYGEARADSRLPKERMARAVNRLVAEEIIERCDVFVKTNNNAQRRSLGLRRRPLERSGFA
jgi:replicative DNA helicase